MRKLSVAFVTLHRHAKLRVTKVSQVSVLPNHGTAATGLHSYLHHGGGSGLGPLERLRILGCGKRTRLIVGCRCCEGGEEDNEVCLESGGGSEAWQQRTHKVLRIGNGTLSWSVGAGPA
jgi:hypothetical protein